MGIRSSSLQIVTYKTVHKLKILITQLGKPATTLMDGWIERIIKTMKDKEASTVSHIPSFFASFSSIVFVILSIQAVYAGIYPNFAKMLEPDVRRLSKWWKYWLEAIKM